LDDAEMLEVAKHVARAVIQALDRPDVTAETIKNVAIDALGGAFERADTAIRTAEQRLEGR
jgi:hypothetical protein